MNIVMIGPPGSGKSTQAELLAEKLSIRHISTGAVFRHIAAQDSPRGQKVKAILDVGGLISDELVFEIIDSHLKNITGGFVIEGFPRTVPQARKEPFPIDKVIYINISDSEVTKRLQGRGRGDDTPDLIRERLRLYHLQTEPILDYYRKQGKLVEVDGTASISVVQHEILSAVVQANDNR